MNQTARSIGLTLWAAGSLALTLSFSVELAAQCAMCRTALTSAEGQRWALGIYAGGMLLVAVLCLIITSVLAVIFRPQLFAALSQARARWPKLTRALSLLRASD